MFHYQSFKTYLRQLCLGSKDCTGKIHALSYLSIHPHTRARTHTHTHTHKQMSKLHRRLLREIRTGGIWWINMNGKKPKQAILAKEVFASMEEAD
jgi:hypothetical protein